MHRTLPLLALALIATLTGCNDSNDPPPEPKVQQMGYGEVETYDAARHPDGHIIQPGETAVLALEAANGTAAPTPEGDTSSIGIDEVTFDVKDAGPLTLALTEADLAVIAKTELWTLTGGLLAQVDRQAPSRTVSLTAGRYLLRVHSGHSNAKPVSLFVYPTVATPSQTNAQRLANPAQVQQLLQTNSCPDCDLSGANLSRVNLSNANLSGAILTSANLSGTTMTSAILNDADLTQANLKQVRLSLALLSGANLPGADLTDADLIQTELSGAYLSHANLTTANLTGAILTAADLTWANLTNANLTEANLTYANLGQAILTDADLTSANLSGAIWIDGLTICAPNSIGQCN